jgi:putative endonuclease
MSKFYYVYVLQSGKDQSLYVGHTTDLKRRLEEHNGGKVSSTSDKRSWKLIYWEGCLSQQDTMEREKYFKTTWGKRYIKKRLQNYFAK